jgi:hypothetical protein
MNKNFYTPENIEAYIQNRLSPGERSHFESEISKDPLLKNELNLQQDIIESLKSYRKTQLKSRLNNIEVSMTPNYYGAKIAASIIITSLLGLGVYSYFGKKSETPVTSEVSREIKINKPDSEISAEPSLNNTKIEAPVSSSNTPKSTENLSNSGNKVSGKKSSTNNSSISSISSGSQNMVETFENDQFQSNNNITLPDGKIAQTVESKSNVDITIDGSTENKFHYKFYNNKLFLFGSFDAKKYEILELNTYDGKQVYLYYDNSYFKLNSNQSEVSPLTKIADKKVIEQLNNFNK